MHRALLYLFFPLVLLTACQPMRFVPPEKAAPPIAWTASSLERIGQREPAKNNRDIEIFAARGETESFQVITKSLEGLSEVSLKVSDLRKSQAEVIESSNLTLYREHYVYIGKTSPDYGYANGSQGTGWYADALVPLLNPETGKPLTTGEVKSVAEVLEPGQNQPFWVDVAVPRNAKAGVYRGSYTVLSKQGQFEGEVKLTVWNFELPRRPTLNSTFILWNNKNRAAYTELLKHRVMPGVIKAEDAKALDGYGLNATNLGFWSGANYQTCQAKAPPAVNEIRAARASLPSDLLIYNYAFDEVDLCPGINASLKAWGRALHAADVLHLATVTPTDELLDDGAGSGKPAVDIFVLAADMYRKAGAPMLQKARDKGAKLWSYTALVNQQAANSPTWLIDFAPINHRILPGFINQALGLTGVLYWGVDYRGNRDPWQDQGYPDGGLRYQGEGLLLYPGDKVGLEGLIPSMRLKWIRDGVDDYDYIQLLKQRGKEGIAMEIVRGVARGFQDWNRDPGQLEVSRKAVGELLNLP